MTYLDLSILSEGKDDKILVKNKDLKARCLPSKRILLLPFWCAGTFNQLS